MLDKKAEVIWSIYLIRCNNGSLYTGITTDVTRRFIEHSSSPKGSKYLRGKEPLELVFQQSIGSRSEASILESEVKKMVRSDKEKILNGQIKI